MDYLVACALALYLNRHSGLHGSTAIGSQSSAGLRLDRRQSPRWKKADLPAFVFPRAATIHCTFPPEKAETLPPILTFLLFCSEQRCAPRCSRLAVPTASPSVHTICCSPSECRFSPITFSLLTSLLSHPLCSEDPDSSNRFVPQTAVHQHSQTPSEPLPKADPQHRAGQLPPQLFSHHRRHRGCALGAQGWNLGQQTPQSVTS